MTDYFAGNESIDAKSFDPQYRQGEEEFREFAGQLFHEHQEIVKQVRGMVELDDDARQQAYIKRYERLNERFEKRAGEFATAQLVRLGEARNKLQKGVGEKFGGYLVDLASKTDEELASIIKTAARTGETDLCRAVAQAALDRNNLAIFNQWAQSDPELAESMRLTRSIPTPERIMTRTFAARPPKVKDPKELKPREEDHERVRQAAAQAKAVRAAWFKMPKITRIVGSRSEAIPDTRPR